MAGPRRPSGTASSGPQYCSQCGNAVDPTDRFCSACGGDLSSQSGSHATTRTDDRYRQFRRRIRDRVAEGWEIEYDADDEVVLVDRGFGSIGIHLLLLVFTGGIGNLLYAWYHYSHNAERIVLRADGDDHVSAAEYAEGSPAGEYAADEGSSLFQFVFGLTLLLGGIGAIGTSGLSLLPVLAGIGLILTSLLVLPPTRRRLRERHPPTNFGPTQSVDERLVSEPNRPCSVCSGRVDQGITREYKNEYAFAGIPLYTIEQGENRYCRECRHRELEYATGTHEDGSGGADEASGSATDDGTVDKSLETEGPESTGPR